MNTIKIVSMVGTIISVGSTLLLDWVGNKKLDDKINIKVSEALKKSES